MPPVFMQISKTNKEYKTDHLDFRLSQQIKLDLAHTRRNPEGITTVFHSDLEPWSEGGERERRRGGGT